jgi:signal peptidase I
VRCIDVKLNAWKHAGFLLLLPYSIYRQKKRLGLYMNGTKAVLWALAVVLMLKVFVFDFMIAQGNSMEPAIKSGKVLVISRLRYGLRLPFTQDYLIRWAAPKAGEVVVFYTPSGDLAVKRCVQIEGESFFAQGDNLIASYDSRSYGPVLTGNIIGKVLGY